MSSTLRTKPFVVDPVPTGQVTSLTNLSVPHETTKDSSPDHSTEVCQVLSAVKAFDTNETKTTVTVAIEIPVRRSPLKNELYSTKNKSPSIEIRIVP